MIFTSFDEKVVACLVISLITLLFVLPWTLYKIGWQYYKRTSDNYYLSESSATMPFIDSLLTFLPTLFQNGRYSSRSLHHRITKIVKISVPVSVFCRDRIAMSKTLSQTLNENKMRNGMRRISKKRSVRRSKTF